MDQTLTHDTLAITSTAAWMSYEEFAEEFETRNVLHHYGPDKLVIGKFCALATGVTFIMNGLLSLPVRLIAIPYE